MTGILPTEKTYSFRQTKIDRENQILKIKCKNLRPTNAMDQDDNWVKSDMTLNENFDHKDFLHLVETGNKDFYKSTSLFLKYFFTESRHPTSSSLLSFSSPSPPSLLLRSLSPPSQTLSLMSPSLSLLGPLAVLLLISSAAVSSLLLSLLFPSPKLASLQILESTSSSFYHNHHHHLYHHRDQICYYHHHS